MIGIARRNNLVTAATATTTTTTAAATAATAAVPAAAAATAAEPTTTATTGRPVFLRPGFIHSQGTTVELSSVHSTNGRLRSLFRSHCDKSEPARAAAHPIYHQTDLRHRPVSRERVL